MVGGAERGSGPVQDESVDQSRQREQRQRVQEQDQGDAPDHPQAQVPVSSDSDRGDGRLEGGVEVIFVERVHQPVAQGQLLEAIAQLDEGEVYARRVQLAIELLEHLRRGHVDVGDRLALQDDPVGLALAREPPDLVAEPSRSWRRTAAPPSGRRQRPGAPVASG